ncbi:DUF6624 domain-containing protein [Streptomyces sp. NPDC058417]|uniref:DUF6624 domain-containing protein n=1 Tax=unclassified Streptomyces TaxID=2593676 RepID=UPI0036579C94
MNAPPPTAVQHPPAGTGPSLPTTLLGRAVQADDALVAYGAHLHERVLITSGRDQDCGTQLLLSADWIELCPLTAPTSVDARRATVGLPPIAVALKGVGRRYAANSCAGETPTVVLAGPREQATPRFPTSRAASRDSALRKDR